MPMPISTALFLAAIVMALTGLDVGAWISAGIAVLNESTRAFFALPSSPPGERDTYTIPAAPQQPRVGQHPEDHI